MWYIYSIFKKPLNKKICDSSVNELFNRAPDSLKVNYFFDNLFIFSNTVLSITGNLNNDKKTVSSKNKKFYISFNGEIYNYKDLNTKYLNHIYDTDTEVLVNLHEKINFNKIPNLLNGMFAYGILDINKKEIKLVTDPQGEKSIYYYNDNNYFLVSSTIKSIISFLKKSKIKVDIDKNVLKDYFSTRHYMPIKKTCFKNINILENSSILKFNLNNLSLKYLKYDNPLDWISEKDYIIYSKIKEEELLELLDFELNSQAKIMLPKKKFGSIFSGGIDSSLQSAILANQVTHLILKYKS